MDVHRLRRALSARIPGLLFALPMLCGAAEIPATIPALKEWEPAPGTCSLGPATRIVLKASAGTAGEATARVLARDLRWLAGWNVPVAHGDPRPGDIALVADPGSRVVTSEGYRMVVGDWVELRADSEAGLFYGTRTLLQLLKRGTPLPRGTARDWPDYPERGLMVDVGRKYFSVAWIKDQIVDMAYAKMNLLHLHLSDDLGLRVASTKHPQLASSRHYTRAELREIIALAAEHHVQIIPEIDVPGHAGWLRPSRPHLLLGSNDLGTHYLDITNPEALGIVQDLLEEYLPLFPGPYWHMGADEYIGAANYARYPRLETFAKERYGPAANGFDAYLGFIAWVHAQVKSKGKILRTWADAYEYHALNPASPVPLDPAIIQEAWNAFQDPRAMASSGFQVQNASFHPTYYNLGAYRGEEAVLYEAWAPHLRLGGWERSGWDYPITMEPRHPRLLGAKLSVWCDSPESESEAQVAEGIFGRMRAIAQNSWGGPKAAAGYGEFRSLIAALGRAPGYRQDHSLGLEPSWKASPASRLRGPFLGSRSWRPHDLLGRPRAR